MLFEFIASQREEILRRSKAAIGKRKAPRPTRAELSSGLPIFLDQLIETLKAKLDPGSRSPKMKRGATQHGRALLAQGFTIAQVVHDYGGVCQAITGLAVEVGALISALEFQVLNGCLDDAIADAVTEFSAERDEEVAAREVERLGVLAHEMRNLLGSATLSYQAVVNGSVGIGGSTGTILGRSLRGMGVLLDRSLAEVRLSSGLYQGQPLLLAEVLEEVEVAAALDARARGLELTILPPHYGVVVEADRQLLIAALSNLIQNAFKFTCAQGLVSLRTSVQEGWIKIEVEDQCGGLPPGKAETLFEPFAQSGRNRSGLGLGLTISRKSIRLFGGDVSVRDLPGQGCVFTVTLPVSIHPLLPSAEVEGLA